MDDYPYDTWPLDHNAVSDALLQSAPSRVDPWQMTSRLGPGGSLLNSAATALDSYVGQAPASWHTDPPVTLAMTHCELGHHPPGAGHLAVGATQSDFVSSQANNAATHNTRQNLRFPPTDHEGTWTLPGDPLLWSNAVDLENSLGPPNRGDYNSFGGACQLISPSFPLDPHRWVTEDRANPLSFRDSASDPSSQYPAQTGVYSASGGSGLGPTHLNPHSLSWTGLAGNGSYSSTQPNASHLPYPGGSPNDALCQGAIQVMGPDPSTFALVQPVNPYLFYSPAAETVPELELATSLDDHHSHLLDGPLLIVEIARLRAHKPRRAANLGVLLNNSAETLRHLGPLDVGFGGPKLDSGSGERAGRRGNCDDWGGRVFVPGQAQESRLTAERKGHDGTRENSFPGRGSLLTKTGSGWVFNGRPVPPPGDIEGVSNVCWKSSRARSKRTWKVGKPRGASKARRSNLVPVSLRMTGGVTAGGSTPKVCPLG